MHPIPADELYCHYCSKQYKTLWSFKRHITTRHGLGLAARLELLTDEEEAERQVEMAKRGQQDDPRFVKELAKRRNKRGESCDFAEEVAKRKGAS
jgi:hypothetical protein